MSLMQEAMTKNDWERREKGLPPLKVKVIPRPEPAKPDIENEIKFKDIPADDFVELEYAKRNTLKNREGLRFIGYDVSMILNSVAKRKPGRPKESEREEVLTESKTLVGWMQEGEFLTLVRNFRKKINPQVINW
ncbi:MAG: hypothetical protein MUO26_01850 [Methanotrichaceae archaeon]|nr:hypothetical protein [Methanotrichaceae archaeon]